MPHRQKTMTPAQVVIWEKTPPKYRSRGYTAESRAIHAPIYDETSIRFMVRRMAERLEGNLTAQGVEAFEAWMQRLIWNESLWLAKASYDFRPVLIHQLDDVCRTMFPHIGTEKERMEDALFVELKRLPDSSVVPTPQRRLAAVPSPNWTHKAS